MIEKETKIIIVDEEDKELIQKMISLPDEKKLLVKGIMIGLNLREPKRHMTN